MTDKDGNLLWFDNYTGWNHLKKDEWVYKNVHQPFRLQNQYVDRDTGLHYSFFRYYKPDAGRYVNQDPIGLWGGENLYTFSTNTQSWVKFLGLRGVYFFTDMTQSYIGKGPLLRMRRLIRYRTEPKQSNPMS